MKTPGTQEITADISRWRAHAADANSRITKLNAQLDTAGPEADTAPLFQALAVEREKVAHANARITKLTATLPLLQEQEATAEATALAATVAADHEARVKQLPALYAAVQKALTDLVQRSEAYAGAVRDVARTPDLLHGLHLRSPEATIPAITPAPPLAPILTDALLATVARLSAPSRRTRLSVVTTDHATPTERRNAELRALSAWYGPNRGSLPPVLRKFFDAVGIPEPAETQKQQALRVERDQRDRAFAEELAHAAPARLTRHGL